MCAESGNARRLGVLVAALSAAVGCSTNAEITRVNGPSVDAEIIGSDDESVYVKTDTGTHAIPRREIIDIDHPGDTAIGFGAGLTGYGILNIAVGAKDCDKHQGGAAYCVGVYTPAAAGVLLLGWGIAVHEASAQSLDTRVHRLPSSQRSMRWTIAPAADPVSRSGALAFGAQFSDARAFRRRQCRAPARSRRNREALEPARRILVT